MSERGSFVTEYMYCHNCFLKMQAVLERHLQFITYPVNTRINDSGEEVKEPTSIIAGKTRGTSSNEVINEFQYCIFDKDNAPCHPVRFCVIDEDDQKLFIVNADGVVEDMNK